MAKFEKRLLAHQLRRGGWSIKSIAQYLQVSKSSVSIWCRDVPLTDYQKKKLIQNAILAGRRGGLMGAETNRRKKEKAIFTYEEQGRKTIKKLSKRDFLLLGIALYWAEGSKGGKLSFVNSDPDMISFIYRWFQEIMSVNKEDFIPRIFINEMHRPRIEKVLYFWAHLLSLPKNQFRKTIFIKTKQKKIYENYETYYGMLALRMKCSTNLLYRINGLIKSVKKVSLQAKVAQW